jgi:hypothetical protein
MLPLVILCYIIVSVVSHIIVQRAPSKLASNVSLPDPAVVGGASTPICDNGGTKNVIVDALSRTQTLQWGTGTVSSTQSPAICRSSMSMDYDPSWQYGVTKIDWKTQVNLPAKSQAILKFSSAFDPKLLDDKAFLVSNQSSWSLFYVVVHADKRVVVGNSMAYIRSTHYAVEQPLRLRGLQPSLVPVRDKIAAHIRGQYGI